MPVDPMIFDDGGSTRIKRLLAAGLGALDGLLDVDPASNPPQSTETVKGPFTQINVVSIDKTGIATQVIASALVPNDNFTLTSGNGQTVSGTIDATSRLVITVQGAANNAPLVEAKQFNRKRRYVVANAGPIATVVGTFNGAPRLFNVPPANIYTAVVLT